MHFIARWTRWRVQSTLDKINEILFRLDAVGDFVDITYDWKNSVESASLPNDFVVQSAPCMMS